METQKEAISTVGRGYPAQTMQWPDICGLHESLARTHGVDANVFRVREHSPQIVTAGWIDGERSIEQLIAKLERCQNDLRLIGELIIPDSQVLCDQRTLVCRFVDRLKMLKDGTGSSSPPPAKDIPATSHARFFRSERLNGDGVVYFFDYHKKSKTAGGGRETCSMSERLRALKRSDKEAVGFFAGLLAKTLLGGFSVCVVPSHRRRNGGSGIREVAVKLTKRGEIADATDCLERFRTIKKQAISHRKRDIDMHLQSIRIRTGHDVRGKDMLLLDDVGTSGWSMAGCRRILTEAGSAAVKCVVLGRTVNETGENVTNAMRRAVMVH